MARLPQGRGLRKGEDAAVNQGESYAIRRELKPKVGGWLITTVGENVNGHQDTTGAVVQTTTRLYYVPERLRATALYEARVNVCTASAGQTVQTALYLYADSKFVCIAPTHVTFDASTTGLKRVPLPSEVVVQPDSHLFLGVWASDGVVALEGFQSGAGAAPKVVRRRSGTVLATAPQPSYTIINMPVVTTGSSDTPMVAYLSKEASIVL